jgi:methylenetetrahydrofolate reductase (NADPH)
MSLKEALEKGKFVVTTEIQTPIDEEPEDVIESLAGVRGRVESFTIKDPDIEGIVADSINMCEVLKKNRFDSIYQTTTRDKNRPQLQKDLLLAHEKGVENLLVFTQDYRITGDSLQEMMFFHVDSGKLASVLEHMREGRTIDGKELRSKAEFVVGSGVESSWGKNVPELEMKEMEEMTRVGTGYFLTTPVFDADTFEKYMKHARTFGVPVIAEIMILRTAGLAQFLNRHFKSGLVPEWMIKKLLKAPDKEKASIEIFADTVNSLKDLCQGIHVITLGVREKLPKYFDAAKLR